MEPLGKRIARAFLNFLVPHDRNDFRPHLFRIAGFAAALLLVFFFAAGAIVYQLSLSRSSYLASVLPGVLIDLANSDRAGYSLASLSVDPKLVAAAQLKANDMAAKGYFAHVSPDGTTPWYWFAQAGYAFVYAGENLAIDFDDSAAVNRAWMDSPTHRANILGAHYTQIGIATAEGTYNGRHTTFVVEEFGSPAADAGSATDAPLSTTQTAPAAPAATSTAGAVPEQPVTPLETARPTLEGAPQVSGAETFMAVASASATPSAASSSLAQEVATASAPAAVSLPAQTASPMAAGILTSPSRMLGLLYLLFAAFLGLAGIAILIIEHPHRGRHLIQLVVLLAMLAALYEIVALGTFSSFTIG